MIIIIDIFIIVIITILSIYNSFNKQFINEILRLISLVLAIFLTNLTSINLALNELITNNIFHYDIWCDDMTLYFLMYFPHYFCIDT